MYFYNLSRDNQGRLYCYYKDENEKLRKVYLQRIRDNGFGNYRITVERVPYETYLDAEAMKATAPKE